MIFFYPDTDRQGVDKITSQHKAVVLLPQEVLLQLPGGTWKGCGVVQLIWKTRNYDIIVFIHIFVFGRKINTQMGLQIGVQCLSSIFRYLFFA